MKEVEKEIVLPKDFFILDEKSCAIAMADTKEKANAKAKQYANEFPGSLFLVVQAVVAYSIVPVDNEQVTIGVRFDGR